MSGWEHPGHYTAKARAFEERSRAALIDLFLQDCLPHLRDTARSLGYTLAIHGSLRRDLDVIAVPWTDRAKSADELLERISATCRDLTGWGHVHADEWTAKPHGRVARTILATSDIHLDLSVMPRVPKVEEPEDEQNAR